MITTREAMKVRCIGEGRELNLNDCGVRRANGIWTCVEKRNGSTVLAQRRNGYLRVRAYNLKEKIVDVNVLRPGSSKFDKYNERVQ